MKALVEGFSIVVAGSWNTGLLSPKWLGKHVFDTQDVMMEFALGPTVGARFINQDVALAVGAAKLSIIPIVLKKDALERCAEYGVKILSILKHTPVTGLGMNFRFLDEDPNSEYAQLVSKPYATKLADFGLKEQNFDLRQTFVVDGGDVHLNLTSTFRSKKVQMDLNYHWGVESADEAREALATGYNTWAQRASDLLDEVYDHDMSAFNATLAGQD